jgi:hypothetical protein
VHDSMLGSAPAMTPQMGAVLGLMGALAFGCETIWLVHAYDDGVVSPILDGGRDDATDATAADTRFRRQPGGRYGFEIPFRSRRMRCRLRRKTRRRLGGLTLRRAEFAPAGRQPEFRETIFLLTRSDSVAWSDWAAKTTFRDYRRVRP